jgi:8-amino-7-oxononanoate synthase
MSLRDDATSVLADLEAKGRLRAHRVVTGSPGPRTSLRSNSGDGAVEQVVHNFSSNDYLGLAGDARLQEAAIAVMRTSGVGATASRLIMTHEEHDALEVELADWLQAERVQLFNSGYAANLGLLSTLAGPEDVIFSDQLNHASLIDGSRLSRAKVVVYKHADLEDLERQLQAVEGRRRLIVSESVFSMDGDVADVVGLERLARQHGAVFLLDEAHAVGVVGPEGRGVAAAQGVTPDLLVGTLGKAFGCYGAFVAGAVQPVDWLWNRARSLVFSTGLPPMISAAARTALMIIRGLEGTERRETVSCNAARLASGIRAVAHSHILAWIIGSDSAAVSASQKLLSRGLFAQAIRPPTVPEGTARLRLAVGMQSETAIDELVHELLAL